MTVEREGAEVEERAGGVAPGVDVEVVRGAAGGEGSLEAEGWTGGVGEEVRVGATAEA